MNAHHFNLGWGYILEIYDTPFHWLGINIVTIGDNGFYRCVWEVLVIPGKF